MLKNLAWGKSEVRREIQWCILCFTDRSEVFPPAKLIKTILGFSPSVLIPLFLH